MLERYYNLFDPAQHYSQLLFRAGDGLQSRELNEIQSTLIHRLQGVADALLKDGDIVSGANLQIDADTGLVTLEAGDCAYFDASLPHQLRQRGNTPSEVLVITHTEYGRNR